MALLRKSCKTMAHEVTHIFGLRHCIYYSCIMNGNNGTEFAPLHLCPICLRKLQSAAAFDIYKRYRNMERYYARHGWGALEEFVQQRQLAMIYGKGQGEGGGKYRIKEPQELLKATVRSLDEVIAAASL